MADASQLTQEQYRDARERVAVYLTGEAFHEPEELLKAERLLDAGIIDLQAALPKPTQGKAEAAATALEDALKRVHERTQGKKLTADEEQLEADVDTMIFEGGTLYRGPIGTPLDGIVGPRTKLTMRVATLPLEAVEALERIVQAYKHVLDSGAEQSWYGTRRGKEAVFQDIESNWRAARIDEVPENVARKLATAGGNVLVALIAQERLAKPE